MHSGSLLRRSSVSPFSLPSAIRAGLLVLLLCACSFSSGTILFPSVRFQAASSTPIPPTPTLILVLKGPQDSPPTPFQPITNTPTPQPSPTPTVTPSPTSTATSTPTPAPSPTNTNTPEASATLTLTSSPTPTFSPSTTPLFDDLGLPAEASVGPVAGYAQSLSLSCESRSAVDWAAFWGYSIGELEFQARLPHTDNPNTGFVGNPNGEPGQIPPDSYGVHAPPVAELLRVYGISARSQTGMRPDDLRREVSQGRPVIVWIVGHVWKGYSVSYTASDGETLVVAHYEHTGVVSAYTPETVTIVDGGDVYTVTWARFLESWSVLGNMGIVYAGP